MHKREAGHVLMIGGEQGTLGAVMLASKAAYRVGAGLVTVATRPEHTAAVTAFCPEAMVYG